MRSTITHPHGDVARGILQRFHDARHSLGANLLSCTTQAQGGFD